MKRGVSMLLKEVVYIILAIIALMILYSFVGKLLGFFTIQEQEMAYGMLNNVKNSLNSIPSGDSDEIYVYTPQNLYFITFNKSQGPEKAIVPEGCGFQSCICICNEDCSKNYCIPIGKPLTINNESIKLKIPTSLVVVSKPEEFAVFNPQSEGKGKTEEIAKKDTIEGIALIYKYSLISRARSDISKVQYIVLHHTGGSTFQSAYETLNQRGLSVHYIIDEYGKIYYLVDEKRMAYHALGFNDVSIGIEIVNTGNKNDPYTEAQYVSITKLLQSITSRLNIPYDNKHIMGHYETPEGINRKWDPSPNFEWAKINLPDHVSIALAKVPSGAGYA